jgi:hypothetical protein
MALIALFLWASYANAFLILSSAAGSQVQVNYLIQFEESISKQKKPQEDLVNAW